MKTSEFTTFLKSCGCYLLRHGANHDIWKNPETGDTTAVPRHGSKEMTKGTVQKIKKDLGL